MCEDKEAKHIMKFSEICRLCMCSQRILQPLYNSEENLQEKICTISSKVKASIEDGLPNQVCKQCVELVNTCYNFKVQCEESDVILRHYLSDISQHQKSSEELFNDDKSKTSLSTVSTHEYRHKQVGLLISKPNDQLDLQGKAATSFGVYGTYDMNMTADCNESDFKEEDLNLHCSENGKDNSEHKLISELYIQETPYYDNSDTRKKALETISKIKSHIALPVKYHQCAVCGKSVQKLKLHMKMHTGEKPYQCSICGQRFIQKGSLQKHNTLHTGERPYSCTLCGKSFRCKSDLNQHTKLHTGDAHKCSICEKEFTTRQNLDSHIRTHTGEKPYLCHACGLHFTQKGALTKHSRIHANDRPHHCSVCNKRFITQSALNLHYRTHTGEKPYTCATCQKSFTDRGYFMRHFMIHSGKKSFACFMCGKAFSQKISLKRHIRLHTGEKPFECAFCGEDYVLKRDLKRHSERIHNTK